MPCVRWGNFDRTVLLPGTVFEADDSVVPTGFVRTCVRSGCGTSRQGPGQGLLPGSRHARGRDLVRAPGPGRRGLGADDQFLGPAGPEPNLRASWRGIVLGDSYMQGLFVGDQETPTECLKRELQSRLHAPVEVLNTGHLGYSPEQYYYTLVEYGRRFPPQFVVVSIFANDFGGDVEEFFDGKGDWEEGSYWVLRIREFCLARNAHFLVVPAPWVNQIEGPQLAGNYPGLLSNVLEATGLEYLDPIDDFATAHLAASLASQSEPGSLPPAARSSTVAWATDIFPPRVSRLGRGVGAGSSSDRKTDLSADDKLARTQAEAKALVTPRSP